MTRFARAKGSKSSNEKAPEDSTPWEVMKEQLLQSKKENEESKKRLEAENQRIENYQNFLKEQKVQKKKATWCEFPETSQSQQNGNESPKKKKKQNKTNEILQNTSTELEVSEVTNTVNDAVPSSQIKKKKKKKNIEHTDNVPENENTSQSQQNGNEPSKKKKKQNKTNEVLQNTSTEMELSKVTNTVEDTVLLSQKKKKKKKKNIEQTDNVLENENTSKIELPEAENEAKVPNKSQKKKNKKPKQPVQMNKSDQSETEQSKHPLQSSNFTGINNQNNNKGQQKKRKPKNLVDGKPVRRKEINDRSFQLIINGKEVELVRFDGFPVMKKDADRLQELKNNMIKKGIPKSEVQRTMKLERRRAEKALARMKREVCYNCRKGGHNLSDCPELKSKIPGVDAPDGVCFKCGSTEHKQFECKVQKDKEFKFATCFICREPGHIARQCPDNPKGLYPNGGSCKLCGDVTHLRKDCPTVKDQREETSIKLPTLEDNNIEDIGAQPKTSSTEVVKKPKKIKF